MMRRAKGATLPEIMKATDWQAHSVHGFLSTAGAKLGLKIESTRSEMDSALTRLLSKPPLLNKAAPREGSGFSKTLHARWTPLGWTRFDLHCIRLHLARPGSTLHIRVPECSRTHFVSSSPRRPSNQPYRKRTPRVSYTDSLFGTATIARARAFTTAAMPSMREELFERSGLVNIRLSSMISFRIAGSFRRKC
jgi:Protein of unknown function (DUF3489)